MVGPTTTDDLLDERLSSVGVADVADGRVAVEQLLDVHLPMLICANLLQRAHDVRERRLVTPRVAHARLAVQLRGLATGEANPVTQVGASASSCDLDAIHAELGRAGGRRRPR